jgi:hypothetical protein
LLYLVRINCGCNFAECQSKSKTRYGRRAGDDIRDLSNHRWTGAEKTIGNGQGAAIVQALQQFVGLKYRFSMFPGSRRDPSLEIQTAVFGCEGAKFDRGSHFRLL